MAFAASAPVADAREPFGSKARVTSYYRSRVALIQWEGELYDGEIDRDEGSGFLIGDTLMLTSSHVIPRVDNYRRLTLTVRFLTEGGTDAVDATLTERDSDTDVAILRLAAPRPIARPPCPIESFANTVSAPPGSDIVVLGYPVGTGFSVTAGVVSNQNSPGRWQTDAAINPGNSGGPVFDLDGYLLGFAVAGMTWFGDDRNGSYVSGVNFFVPVQALMASPVSKYLSTAPICWTVADAGPAPAQTPVADAVAAAATSSAPSTAAAQWALTLNQAREALAMADLTAVLAYAAEPPLPPLPPLSTEATTVARATRPALPDAAGSESGIQADATHNDGLLRELSEQVPISLMKDDHRGLLKTSRTYTKRVVAEPGYVIEHCKIHAQSANNSTATVCTVAADGKSAEFRTTLESGPFYDRWRGWWHGDLTLSQRLAPAEGAQRALQH